VPARIITALLLSASLLLASPHLTVTSKVVHDGKLDYLLVNGVKVFSAFADTIADTIEIGKTLESNGRTYQLVTYTDNDHFGFNGPPDYCYVDIYCVVIDCTAHRIAAKFRLGSSLRSMDDRIIYCIKKWKPNFNNLTLEGPEGRTETINLESKGGFSPEQPLCPHSPSIVP